MELIPPKVAVKAELDTVQQGFSVTREHLANLIHIRQCSFR